MIILLPPVAGPALASALPRRRSLRGRPCQVTIMCGLIALRAGLSRAATPQLPPRTPEPRASLAHIALLLTRLNPPYAPLLAPGRSPPSGSALALTRLRQRLFLPSSHAHPTPVPAHACSRVARAHSEPQTHACTGPTPGPTPLSVSARARRLCRSPVAQHRTCTRCCSTPASPALLQRLSSCISSLFLRTRLHQLAQGRQPLAQLGAAPAPVLRPPLARAWACPHQVTPHRAARSPPGAAPPGAGLPAQRSLPQPPSACCRSPPAPLPNRAARRARLKPRPSTPAAAARGPRRAALCSARGTNRRRQGGREVEIG
jgi:hypothetical protein